MAWLDYFVNSIAGARVMVSPVGSPYVAMEIARGEFVEIRMTTNVLLLPFQITFRSSTEIRDYGFAGTRELSRALALQVADLRLNSQQELSVTPY